MDRQERIQRLNQVIEHLNSYSDPFMCAIQHMLRTAVKVEQLEGHVEELKAAGERLLPFLPDMEPIGAAAFSENLQAAHAFRRVLGGINNG